jgi:chromosome segregation ATPase
MTTNESGVAFSRTFGGYDAAEAARVITELRTAAATQEQTLAKAEAEIRRLERKIHERQGTKPRFAELGAAFESAITLAEEQAAKLIADAQKETQAQLQEVTANATSRSKASALKSRSDVAAAKEEAEKIRRTANEAAKKARTQIKDNHQKVAQERAQVDKMSAAVLADAESQIAALREKANSEIDSAMSAALEELRRAEELAGRIDNETRILNEKAAKEIATILADAEKYAAQTKSEADEHTESSNKRADAVSAETEKYVSALQSRAAKTLEEARSRSEQALGNAEKITGEITASSQVFVENMTRDLEDRLDKARRNLEDISGFLYTIRSLTNGFDLGELSVARSRVSSDRANSSVAVAELLEG